MEWIQFGILLITLGSFVWSNKADMNAYRAEASADRRDMLNIIRAVESEMKDFHGRLERIDAEFKAYLMRSRGGDSVDK